MAVDESEPGNEFEFKHRILGAVILIAAAVFLLPMILKDSPMLGESPIEKSDLKFFKQEAEGFKSRVRPVREKPIDSTAFSPRRLEGDNDTPPLMGDSVAVNRDSKAGKGSEVAAVSATKKSKAEPKDPPAGETSAASKPESEKSPAAVAAKAPASSSKAAPVIERGWIVQLGLFGDRQNADRFSAKFVSAGYNTQVTPVKTSSGKKLNRVWYGPFEKRVDAAKKRTEIEKALGEKGFIVAYP